MTEPKFKTGDVVRLKSGGPPMTVGSIPSSEHSYGPRVEVVWVRNERLRFEVVPPETLVKADPAPAATDWEREVQTITSENDTLARELVEATQVCNALARERDALRESWNLATEARNNLKDELNKANAKTRDAELARQRLVDDMAIANGVARDFRALAAKLVELDRENLPIDVKSLIAEARLAVSR